MIPYYNTGVTVELGELIDSGFQLWGFDYPSYYKGAEKEAFEQKVIDHYRFRQIGQETPARFRHYFQTRVREIMPYYIQLYKFQEKVDAIDDPLESYHLTEEYHQTREGSGTVTGATSDSSTTKATGKNERESGREFTRRFSDTPQGTVTELDSFLTEATRENESQDETLNTTDTTTATSSGTSDTTTENSEGMDYSLVRRGNIGVQPLGTEVKDIRSSFINIDQMVIEALSNLFLMVY